jgi:hypothetical protein
MSNYTTNTIPNACNVPLNLRTGTIPDMGVALRDWFQLMTFSRVVKETVGYQVMETVENVSFWGVIMPFTSRELMMKPEGERAWSWFKVYAQAAPAGSLATLNVDDVGLWNGIQTRVMSRTYYAIYGYVEMNWLQDWTESGPPTP